MSKRKSGIRARAAPARAPYAALARRMPLLRVYPPFFTDFTNFTDFNTCRIDFCQFFAKFFLPPIAMIDPL